MSDEAAPRGRGVAWAPNAPAICTLWSSHRTAGWYAAVVTVPAVVSPAHEDRVIGLAAVAPWEGMAGHGIWLRNRNQCVEIP